MYLGKEKCSAVLQLLRIFFRVSPFSSFSSTFDYSLYISTFIVSKSVISFKSRTIDREGSANFLYAYTDALERSIVANKQEEACLNTIFSLITGDADAPSY